jgi:hypothetical protein
MLPHGPRRVDTYLLFSASDRKCYARWRINHPQILTREYLYIQRTKYKRNLDRPYDLNGLFLTVKHTTYVKKNESTQTQTNKKKKIQP